MHEPVETPIAVEPNPMAANILLVDDHPENLTALDAILSPLGENLLFASSGEEALRYVLKYDLACILMDVQMPGMTGFEAAALIRGREKSSHVPILFITAFSKEQEAVFKGYSIGAVDYISKPFNPDILLSKIRVFVDLYKKTRQIQVQERLIHEAELRELERRQQERERELEEQRLLALKTELEVRVEERTEELRAANEEMEAFCYSVSHDLRAPLRAVMSTSQILLQDAQDKLTGEELEQLQRQSNAARKLGSLIDDLLHLSRLGRKKMELVEIDLSWMMGEIAADLAGRFTDRVIEVHIEPGMRALADAGLVHILLYNLLENAFKYSPDGGLIRAYAERKGDTVTYGVSDQGIGFDMKYGKKLFMPFERLVPDREFPGTGIGLAIVERIVHRHGGTVWAESTPGSGATFRFTL